MANLPANVLGRLAHLVEEAVIKSSKVEFNEAPERQGGYLVIKCVQTGDLLLAQKIGQVPPDKVEACLKFATEKCDRILANDGHVSSWQSRDFAQQHYGGGIRIGNHAMAFSGCKEYTDEASCLYAAKKGSMLDGDQVVEITNISDACTDYSVTVTKFLEALEAA